jgi:hypothetical protein
MLEKTLSEVVLRSQIALMDQNLLAERRTREHDEKMISDLKVQFGKEFTSTSRTELSHMS